MSTSIEIAHLSKSFGASAVVRDLSLTVEAGEFFTLLGPSGSGKTTTLMMVAGFVEPDGGSIDIGGRPILGLPPERRNLGVVFQSYALFPNMTVAENVAFPLRMRRVARGNAERKVREALALVDLAAFAERRVQQLSGGQQQRVALARALVFEPPVLLMDEPLGALDRKLREQLQIEIRRIQRTLGVTVLYVTHDQEEALVLSDRIAVMANGEIQQMGPAAEVYERPQTAFVARFLGESNLLEGRVAGREGGFVEVELARGGGRICAVSASAPTAASVQVLVRPESLVLSAERATQGNSIAGEVVMVEYLGASIRYTVETAAGALNARTPRSGAGPRFKVGARLFLAWQPQDAHLLS